jgi:hypothetical protein
MLSIVTVACGTSDELTPRGEVITGPDDGLPAQCNPLRSAGVCLLPFPSSAFLDADAASETGSRMHLTAEAMPQALSGGPLDPTRLNQADGFSPTSELLAYFPERIDPASLPSITEPSTSLSPSSATVLVDMTTGELVAHFSEPDGQAAGEDDRQALIMRPTTRLATGHRYAAAVTRSIRTLDGAVPASPVGFQAALDDPDSTLGRTMSDVIAALEAAGVPKSALVLAWDFVTASDASLTRTMRAMQERTLELTPATGLGYVITSVETDFSEHTLTRVRGTFKVPKFLSETDNAIAETGLLYDGDGLPEPEGTYDAPFTLLVPRQAAEGPVSLALFGHGFLGSAEGELGDAGGSYLQDFGDEQGFALIGTNWTGLSMYEGVSSAGSQATAVALQDMNKFSYISDRLQQSIVNAMVLARTARAIVVDPKIGVSSIDASRVDYYGISLGGVMGSALMGWSPDLARGVLNVGGAGWTTLTQRSTNWSLFKLIVDGGYRDRIDQQVLLDVLQTYFDPIDGLTVAPSMLDKKQILLQMAVNDDSVPNPATTILARTMSLPLLDDSPIDIFQLTRAKGPLSSALTVWDTHQEAPPLTNVPNPISKDNTAHDQNRRLPKVRAQIEHFLKQGEVLSTCDGVCDPD